MNMRMYHIENNPIIKKVNVFIKKDRDKIKELILYGGDYTYSKDKHNNHFIRFTPDNFKQMLTISQMARVKPNHPFEHVTRVTSFALTWTLNTKDFLPVKMAEITISYDERNELFFKDWR